MNKEELIKELNFILSLVKKDSRIGKFLLEIKIILDGRL